MDKQYRERPTVKGNYTKEDLIDYVHWRKAKELEKLEIIQEWKDAPENKDKGYEDNEDYRDPLSIEKETWIEITLSTGGDADGYRVLVEDGELTKGFYWWADWGVYEEVPLSKKELDLVSNTYYPQGIVE